MSQTAALIGCILFILWLFTGDRKRRQGCSAALWIPLAWVVILGSRPISSWFALQTDASIDNLEGSPLDRLIFLVLIAAGFLVLLRRRVNWSSIIARNKWLFIYFAYLAVSVLWAEHPFVSFKRWIKDVGNLVMMLIVLSEENPGQAVKALLLRCSYVLIPFSVLLAKYFPEIGRGYNQWTWQPVIVGVTTDKNVLGTTLLVCGTGLFWSFLDLWDHKSGDRRDVLAHLLLLAMTLWLLYKANSATALACTVLCAGILLGMRSRALRNMVQRFGFYSFGVVGLSALLFGALFNVGGVLVGTIGRDLTLTGRTEIWARCLRTGINPLIGTGYSSFWEQKVAERVSEGFYYQLKEAHNGYIDTYLNSGLVGLFLLGAVLVTGAARIRRGLPEGSSFESLRLAFLAMAVIYNFTESAFNGLGLIWCCLLLVILEDSRARRVAMESEAERLAGRVNGFGLGIS